MNQSIWIATVHFARLTDSDHGPAICVLHRLQAGSYTTTKPKQFSAYLAQRE